MRYLKSLNEKGLLELRGAPKTGGYFLITTMDVY